MVYEEGEGLRSQSGDEAAIPEKDKCIRNFIKILRLAFKMATIYKLEHPAFKQTVDELTVSLERLFHFFNPFAIGFSPHSLFIDDRFWEGDKTTTDLARLFHFRKVKRLEIRPGVLLDELLRFVSRIATPIPEFIRTGGSQALLEKENFSHISLELLDYSQLLREEGEEIKEIWPYLLMEAVAEDNRDKLNQLAGTFEKVVGTFNSEDLIQNEELHKNLVPFFRHLKETAQERYRSCARGLLKSVLAARKMPPESKFENLKYLITDLTEEDLASTLWEEVISDDKFDSLSFFIFTKVIDSERHKKISTSLRELFHSDDPKNKKPEVEKKIKTLLSGTSGQLLSDIYPHTLANLLSEISFEKQLNFGHQLLQRNYRFILVNLLAKEAQREYAVKELERILEEWNKIAEEKDFEFLECLLTVLREKASDFASEPAYERLRTSLLRLVEDYILRGETDPQLDDFIDKLAVIKRSANPF